MSTWTPNSREEFRAAIGKLQPGDCIETERLGALAGSAKELLDALEQIGARQAMARLDLKPNTFYRRIKEREEQKMKDYKKVEHEIRSEIKEAARQSRKDLDELKKQVRSEAKEIKKAADEKLELRDVEREMRHDRIRAEVEHHDVVKQMKKDVEAEAKELKKLVGEKE